MRQGHPARLFLLVDIDVEGEPIFAGRVGLQERFEQVGGPVGVAAFAVGVGEAEDGARVVRIIADGELKLAEGESEQAGVFAEEAPVGVSAAGGAGGGDGVLDVGAEGVRGAVAEASAEGEEEGVGHRGNPATSNVGKSKGKLPPSLAFLGLWLLGRTKPVESGSRGWGEITNQ
jgi:hypothetical protein